MEKDNIFSEEQEKELMDRINEIKNQTKKENNNNIETKEETNKKNITGIENVVVYQNNAKKTMKGRKVKLIALIVAGGMLISGIGAAIANKLSQPTEAQLYAQTISSLLVHDETHTILFFEPGQHKTYLYIEFDPNDYSNSEFTTTELYFKLYEEQVKSAWENGYNPFDENDAFCVYDCLSDDIEYHVDSKDGQPYFPIFDGEKYYYSYLVENNVQICLPVELNSDGKATSATFYKPGFPPTIISNPFLEPMQK